MKKFYKEAGIRGCHLTVVHLTKLPSARSSAVLRASDPAAAPLTM